MCGHHQRESETASSPYGHCRSPSAETFSSCSTGHFPASFGPKGPLPAVGLVHHDDIVKQLLTDLGLPSSCAIKFVDTGITACQVSNSTLLRLYPSDISTNLLRNPESSRNRHSARELRPLTSSILFSASTRTRSRLRTVERGHHRTDRPFASPSRHEQDQLQHQYPQPYGELSSHRESLVDLGNYGVSSHQLSRDPYWSP